MEPDIDPTENIFRDVPVPDALSPYLRRVLLADRLDSTQIEFTVRATGYCYMEWVWRGRWAGKVDDQPQFDTETDGKIFVSGQVLDANIAGEISGPPGMIFVEFTAFGQFQLLGIPGDLIIEQAVSPFPLNPDLRTPFEPLASAPAELSAADAIDSLFGCLQHLTTNMHPVDPALLEAGRRMEVENGAIQLMALCEELGLSARVFRRNFQRLNGLSPKRFCRVLKTLRALNALMEEDISIAATAAEAGFSDQAHLSRSFRQFLDETPARSTQDIEKVLKKFVGEARRK